MSVHILFITSHFFYTQTTEALRRLELNCTTTVVPYDDFSHIPQIYRQYQNSCDAIMVSGSSVKRFLELNCPNIDKPITAFQVDSDALHRDILRYALERKSLDFTRIAMDFMLPMDCGYSVADFLEIDDMSAVISQNNAWIHQGFSQHLDSAQIILDRTRELWSQNAIDSVICMYSSNIPQLQALGIPWRCPFLSDAHLKRLIRDALIKIELKNLHDNHPAIIQLFSVESAVMTDELRRILELEVRRFLQEHMIDAVVQFDECCCSIVTSMQVARFLTDEFRRCRLCRLFGKSGLSVISGYGIGTTISHAMNNHPGPRQR